MATIYSLICWGGKDGKATTSINSTTETLTIANHGLVNGTGLVPQSSVNGLTSGTAYYARSTGTNTFTLHPTSADAIANTNIVNLTGTTNLTFKSKYYVDLPSKTRWTLSGTELIYNGLLAWRTARRTASTSYDVEIAEIGMAFTDVHGSAFTIDFNAASTQVTTLVEGVRSDGFHNGNIGAGFVVDTYTVSIARSNTVFDGFTIKKTQFPYVLLDVTYNSGSTIKNMILWHAHATPTEGNLQITASGIRVLNNIIIRGTGGIINYNYQGGRIIANNIVVGCTTGITCGNPADYSFFYNNISVGNTTNWTTIHSSVLGAAGNAGESGNTPFDTIGNTAVTITPASHFTNWDTSAYYANCNFRPASASAPQVETGVRFYADFDSYGDDILDADRLNYVGASYNSAITAGSFVTGKSYTIASIGSTDFTAAGATTASVTFQDTGDTCTYNTHGFANGDPVYFSVITTTTGISTNTLYYVISAATNTFQLASTVGGSAIALTTNGSGTIVRGTFKASGAGSGTGTAILNAKVDIGPYEYSWGEGGWPNEQYTTLSGFVSGSRIKIARQSDGAEIYNANTTSWTPVKTTYNLGTDTQVYIYVRKGSAAPYYKPIRLSATIDDVTGLTYDMTGLQVEDIAAATYTAGVASDWTFNSTTGAITHASGTTRYSVQDLYSWHQDYYDDSATVDDNPLINGITPTQFELINSGTITDGDLEDLFGGSVEFPNGTLWSNLYTAGSLAASHALYVVQNGSKVTSFWANGHIDILVKVSNAGVEIDNGQVTVYARPYGYSYAHYLVDMSAGGRNVAPISTLVDPTTTTISSATAATYSDISITFGTTSHDLGEGGGAGSYRCDIDCAGRTLDQVYAYLMYVTRDASTATLNGESGWKYQKANSAYTANAAAPFGTYAGGFFTVAQGVWLTNYAASETYSFVLTDHAGVTHQLIEPTNQSVTISGATAGSRIQIYDTTSSTELYNGTPVFPYTWSDGSAAVADRAIRLRVSYVSGTSAKNFIEANIGTCGQTAETKDVSYLVSQTNDTTYNTNAIDGPAIYATSGITFTDAATDLVNCNIAGGSVTYPTIYACFVYWNFTATGIANDFTYIAAPDTANYLLSGMKIRNTSATDLVVTGGYGRDATSGLSKDIIDTAGSTGNIFLAPDHVVPYATGSGVTAQDKADITAGVWSEASRTLTSSGDPSASTIASAVIGAVIEGNTTLAESIRLHNAVLAGKVSGAGTGTEVFRDLADTKDRVTSTVDSDGNRTAVTTNVT